MLTTARRNLTRIVFAVVLMTPLVAVWPLTPAFAQKEAVTFALNWLPVSEATAWYVALDKGYFAENNLDVTIRRGFGSGDTVKRIAVKRETFGVVDIGALIPLRLRENAKVKAIAAIYSRPPHALFFHEASGIKTPRDLEGRSIACPANSNVKIAFPAFASKVGINQSKIKWQLVDPAAAYPTFVAGRADVVCAYSVDVAEVMSLDPNQGRLGQFAYAASGLEFYSLVLIAHEDTISEKPDVVRRFTNAALRGVDYAVKNREEGIKILRVHAPENKPGPALAKWSITASELIMTDEVKRWGLGYIVPEKMKSTYDVLTAAFGLDGSKDKAENLFTNEFLK